MKSKFNTRRDLTNHTSSDKWTASCLGSFKVNVDATASVGNGNNAIGMIMRDHLSSFCRARNFPKNDEISVFEAEAREILEA